MLSSSKTFPLFHYGLVFSRSRPETGGDWVAPEWKKQARQQENRNIKEAKRQRRTPVQQMLSHFPGFSFPDLNDMLLTILFPGSHFHASLSPPHMSPYCNSLTRPSPPSFPVPRSCLLTFRIPRFTIRSKTRRSSLLNLSPGTHRRTRRWHRGNRICKSAR